MIGLTNLFDRTGGDLTFRNHYHHRINKNYIENMSTVRLSLQSL